ncbi:MAG: hypothetical protein AB1758_25820, partial [Candidatus Eremiobacterota bacterium]
EPAAVSVPVEAPRPQPVEEPHSEEDTTTEEEEQEALEALFLNPETEPLELLEVLRKRTLARPSSPIIRAAVYHYFSEDDLGLVRFYGELSHSEANHHAHQWNLARAYVQAGQEQLAVSQYQKLLKAAPTPDGFEELAEVYGRLKKLEHAERTREFARKLRQSQKS